MRRIFPVSFFFVQYASATIPSSPLSTFNTHICQIQPNKFKKKNDLSSNQAHMILVLKHKSITTTKSTTTSPHSQKINSNTHLQEKSWLLSAFNYKTLIIINKS
jgi:hypothetical protein